jgi:hypothetical protein
VWFHVECVQAFERTAEGRALKARATPKVDACTSFGQPFENHFDRRACPSVLLGMGKR